MQQIEISKLREHPKIAEYFDDMKLDEWNEFLEEVKNSKPQNPVIVTSDLVIVSGWNIVRAYKELGIQTVLIDMKSYDSEDELIEDIITLNLEELSNTRSRVKKMSALSSLYDIRDKSIKKEKMIRKSTIMERRKAIAAYREDIIELHSGKCDICGMDCKQILVVHHILPLHDGGTNDLENLKVLCPNCHAFIHKEMSFSQENKNSTQEESETSSMYEWISENYSQNANNRLTELFISYIYRRKELGWGKLEQI